MTEKIKHAAVLCSAALTTVSRSEAAAILGSATSAAKAEAAARNGKRGGRPKGTGKPLGQTTRHNMSAGQKARRAREAQERNEVRQDG